MNRLLLVVEDFFLSFLLLCRVVQRHIFLAYIREKVQVSASAYNTVNTNKAEFLVMVGVRYYY